GPTERPAHPPGRGPYWRPTPNPPHQKGTPMSANPHIFDARSIPDEVHSSTKDPEIAEWLKTGPVLGAHEPVHAQRRGHAAFIDEVMPPIGEIEPLGLRGPHGTIPVRVYHPSTPGRADGAALIYLHGGGFIV